MTSRSWARTQARLESSSPSCLYPFIPTPAPRSTLQRCAIITPRPTIENHPIQLRRAPHHFPQRNLHLPPIQRRIRHVRDIPIVLGTNCTARQTRDSDEVLVLVEVTGLDDEDAGVGVFREAVRDCEARGAGADDDVVVGVVGGDVSGASGLGDC